MSAIKLPLKISAALNGSIGIHEQDRLLAIATMNWVAPKEELREKAAQIITAVNSHKELVEILEEIAGLLKPRNNYMESGSPMHKQIKKLIKKIKAS